ncbi:MAG: 3-keto-5-aminohexanoate cleavage protein [Lachnospiraceae bacterium]|jgi:3-keto-5-aminohexanoate cleavage enzyme|nr:3-keto-5-aminohexanoate cleavage protein [Lachnospiraceae bacterium]
MSVPKYMRMPWIKEEKYYEDLGKPLIINVSPGQSMTYKDQNPNMVYTWQEQSDMVNAAMDIGASVAHIHVRNEDGNMAMPLEQYVERSVKAFDRIFAKHPKAVVNLGEPGFLPDTILNHNCIDPESISPEARMKPFMEMIIEAGGGTNKYCELYVVQTGSMTNPLVACVPQDQWDVVGDLFSIVIDFPHNTGKSIQYLESLGVKPEIVLYHDVCITEFKEWVEQQGIGKRPYLFDILLGMHDSLACIPTSDGIEHLMRIRRSLPKESVVQAICGGRNKMAMITASIITGVDMVRIGMEDGIYKYPHKDDLITSCAEQVESVVNICKELGRPIATPEQARKILGLPER